LAIAPDRPVKWVEDLYRGLRRCAKACGCSIAGGETTALPDGAPTVVSVSAVGVVERRHLVLRSGGNPGDVLAVTGRLGGSLASGRHMKFTPRLVEGAWLAAASARRPRAMMDLSDGLAKDLPRLARACGCGFEIDPEALPRHRGCSVQQALGDGEDYELLLAMAPEKWKRLAADWEKRFPRLPLTIIGKLTEDAGNPDCLSGGWEHF
jgi:thiamine-monophosphate kinase